jgi:hypothetical protein
MRKNTLLVLACAAVVFSVPASAAKQDETEGTAKLPQQASDIYKQTDKKAAQRPGQTVIPAPIAPIKGEKGENKQTKGEETAGTAPSPSK